MRKKYFIVAIILLPVLLFSATWYVDQSGSEDFTSIQDAIIDNNVVSGDIIYVNSNIMDPYEPYGPLVIENKDLTIAANGSATVYIEDGGNNDSCIKFLSPTIGTTTLRNLIIRNGGPTSLGGGISIQQCRTVNIENCDIKNNGATFGGGIFYGGVYAGYTCNISNSTISNNAATVSGGGIRVISSNMILQDVVIKSNSAPRGGGVYVNSTSSNSNIEAENVLIYGNSASNTGGAIHIFTETTQSNTIELRNTTIVDNSSTGVGGITVDPDQPGDIVNITVMNSIIYDNDSTPQLPTGYDVDYSCIEGNNVYVGNDNINDDPEFASPSTFSLEYYSPCINEGHPSSTYDDPDGSRADMGYKYYRHDVYDWNYSGIPRTYLWRSFPRLTFSSQVQSNTGQGLAVSEVLENWNPIPDGLDVWFEDEGDEYVSGSYHVVNGWSWDPPNYTISSIYGYKMERDNGAGCLLFSRGLKCTDNTSIFTEAYQASWLGYFLEDSQLVFDAFPQMVIDDALMIQTMEWCISRPSTDHRWTGTPSQCKINYMDCVLIKTVDEDHEFRWETPGRSEEPEYRPVAEHFSFNEDIDYLPVYVEFEENDIPQEVAIYVNDVCRGAQVVEDTISQICAYILEEELGENIEFAFWYDDRSEVERKNSYLVENINTGEYEPGSLVTGMPGIHYKISFKGDFEEIVPAKYNLHCYPNPFNPELTISFSLEETQEVKLEIYNVKGQKVKSLVNESFRPNEYNIVWNGDNSNGSKVSSGVYYIRLQVGENIVNNKVILMK